jgi:hypothetical protein
MINKKDFLFKKQAHDGKIIMVYFSNMIQTN